MHYHLLIVILNIKKKSVPTIDPFLFCLLYFEILCYFESFLKYESYKFFQNTDKLIEFLMQLIILSSS